MPPFRQNRNPSSQKPKRVSKACTSCKRRKIKCNGENPCINCINYNCSCTYPGQRLLPPSASSSAQSSTSTSLGSKIKRITEAIQNLKETDPRVSNMIDQLEKLLDETEPLKNGDSTSASSTLLSRESDFTKDALHTRFSNYCTGSKIIDEYFGANSLYLLLSNGGRQWYIETCTGFDPSFKKTLSESLLNVFFFIDMVVDEKSGVWVNVTSTEELENLLEIDFIEEAYIESLIENHYDEISQFQYKSFKSQQEIELMSKEIFKYKKRLLEDTSCLFFLCFLLECSSLEYAKAISSDDLDDSIKIKLFLRSLIKYCVHLIRAIFFSNNKVEDLEGMLLFLKFSDSKYIDTYLLSLLDYSIHVVKELGLNKIEYYVGLSEEKAELRRELFWEFYNLEKKQCLLTGQRSSFDDEEITCFYPNGVHEIAEKANTGSSIDLTGDNVTDYIRYYEIEFYRFVQQVQNILGRGRIQLSSVSSILEELKMLKDSIDPAIRPGNKILDENPLELNQFQVLKVQTLHVQYNTIYFFIISSFTDTKLQALYDDSGLECCFNILETIFETKVCDFTPINALTKNGIIAFLYMIESFLRNPKQTKSTQIMRYLIKFQFRMVEGSSSYHSMFWRITNVIANYMLEPCVSIYLSVKGSSVPVSLGLLIRDYHERLAKFKDVISSYRNQQSGIDLDADERAFSDLIAPIQDLTSGKKLLFVDSEASDSPES